jgi:acetyl-CoA acetyltransferase
MVSQACATSAVCVELAASSVQSGDDALTLVLTTDRTSNSPLMIYPSPSSLGGAPRTEHWTLDNFARDPNTGQSMLQTAENVAEEIGISRDEPKAPVPAAERALHDADLNWDQVDLVTTHNPFTVNDIYFHRQTGFALEKMNPYGCSLVWGHPQGPTGLRAIIELIEALRERGGGTGVFTGCAAGDTGAAIVLRVQD